jgi:hypothetical protein
MFELMDYCDSIDISVVGAWSNCCWISNCLILSSFFELFVNCNCKSGLLFRLCVGRPRIATIGKSRSRNFDLMANLLDQF